MDNIEIDFVAHIAHLARAGYNVLAYDLRNHGQSSAANGDICGIGRYEWRDCVGAKTYVDTHPRLSQMTVGLYSQCTGGGMLSMKPCLAALNDLKMFGAC